MIVQDSNTNQAEISGNIVTSNFTIKSSPAAFKILASGLYSNKIQSIIRELSCNARDSHTAAGVDRRWNLHLPTNYEPYFSVRDYGVGLSHDEVVSVYTTFFESTKTDSDDYVGCLGLGSKSPFSYTDNFTITAIKDGKINLYTAFIDNTGCPAVAHLSSDTTEQSNGVEVRFAVNTKDFATFASEAQQVMQWFDIRPDSNVTFYASATNVVNLIDDINVETHNTRIGSPVAIMGGVCYPIDINHPGLHQYQYLLKTHLFVLRFDIGDLEVQPSREGLSYIPMTLDAIKDRMIVIERSIAKHCEHRYSDATSVYDKLRIRSELCSHQLTRPTAERLYGDMVITPLINKYPDIGSMTIRISRNDYDLSVVRRHEYTRLTKSSRTTLRIDEDLVIQMLPLAMERAVIIYNDGGFAQHEIKDNVSPKFQSVVVFNKLKDKTKQLDINKLQDDLCGYKIVLSSQMGIIKNTNSRTSKKSAGIYVLTKDLNGRFIWESSTITDVTGYVYVNLEYRRVDEPEVSDRIGGLYNAFGSKLIGISRKSKVDRSKADHYLVAIQQWIDQRTTRDRWVDLIVVSNSSLSYGMRTVIDHLRPYIDQIEDPIIKQLLQSSSNRDPIWVAFNHIIKMMASPTVRGYIDSIQSELTSLDEKYGIVNLSVPYSATNQHKQQIVKLINFVHGNFGENNVI